MRGAPTEESLSPFLVRDFGAQSFKVIQRVHKAWEGPLRKDKEVKGIRNSIIGGGEVLKIPEETWHLSAQGGGGGTIIDSGTTLTYFAEPAYEIIKEAFMRKIKGFPLVETFPPLKPFYNVSGVEKMELPEFAILFADGAVWNFPVENYFIQIEPEDVVCLAILGTPRSALSIIGNYQQQNFHILYDLKKSRLGYAPMKCADV